MLAASYKSQASGYVILRIVIISLFVFQFIGLSAQPNCKLRKNEDGFKVYTCHVDSSRFKSILAEFDISCSSEELISVVMDVTGYKAWQFNTIEAKTLRTISDTEKIYYTAIAAPWPVTDRDMVVHLKIKQNESYLSITTDSEAGILDERPDLVRVPFSRAEWVVTSKNKNQLHVKYTMLIDPGGSVPVWLVNWTCANAPLQSFQKLRRFLEKSKL